MSESPFGDLLGDFGDSTNTSSSTTTTTTKTISYGNFDDDFDPFGSSSAHGQTSQGRDSGMLLDFSSYDTEIKNGESGGRVEFHTDNTKNPFSNMSTDSQPSNPLYDLGDFDSKSANPLYDLGSEMNSNDSSNLMYEFTSESTTKTQSAGSPQYHDYEVDDTIDEAAEEVDLLSGTNEVQEEEEEEDEDAGYGQTRQYQYNDSDPDEVGGEEHQGEVKVVTLEYQTTALNGDPRQWAGHLHDDEDEQPHRGSDDEQPHPGSDDEQPRPGSDDEQPHSGSDDEQPHRGSDDEDNFTGRVQIIEEAATDEELGEESLASQLRAQGHVARDRAAVGGDAGGRQAEEESRTSDEEEELPEDGVEKRVQIHVSEFHDPVDSSRLEEEDDFIQGGVEECHAEVSRTTSDYDDGVADDNRGRGDESEAIYGVLIGSSELGCADIDHFSGDPAEEALEKYCLDREDSDVVDTAGPIDADRSRDQAEDDLEQYCLDREESDVMEDAENDALESLDRLKSSQARDRASSSSADPDAEQAFGEIRYGHDPGSTSDTSLAEEDFGRSSSERSQHPQPQTRELHQDEEVLDGGRTVTRTTRTETRYSGDSRSENRQTSQDFSSNHWDDDRHREHSDFGRQTAEQDVIHFNEMSTTKSKYEAQPSPAPRKQQIDFHQEILSAEGGVYESQPQVVQQWQNEVDEEGVFENQPQKREDVVREADSDKTADLPPVGTAQSMRAKFMSVQQESTTTHTRHDIPPPSYSVRGEYVSEPRGYVEKYEGRPESGVFESEPVHIPDVVRSGEEVKEELPEKGMAKNLANMFRQFSTEKTTASHVVKSKREITPDRTTSRVEYVSEPQSHHVNEYDVRVDAGVFENQPQRQADVVTSDSVPEDYIPERGFAKNVAAKFKQFESTTSSPPQSPGRRKEFTPPRDDDRSHQVVVVESTPEYKPDIVHSTDPLEEALPERGMAKNIAQMFRQMEAGTKSPTSPKAKKEFTPPPRDSGVYENQPRQFHAEYNRPAESGVLENQPLRRDDVVRGDEPPKYEEELPERGAAKNLVSKWRQMESESAKLKSPSSAGRPKEFTPPREEPRAVQYKKSPRTPMSPGSYGQLDNGSVHPSDLPGQYQPQSEESVSESSPQHRSDVIREADTDWQDGLPKKDTAKKMLARFQSIQAEASKPAQVQASRKELDTPSKTTRKDSECSETEYCEDMDNEKQNGEDENKVGRSKSMRAAIQTEKCGACDKTVYAMERLEMNKRVYHKACFRCNQCKAVLTPKTFAINNEVIFCTTHYKQLFATKGNYDEGFGRTQHKKRWSSNPNLAKDTDEDSAS